MRHLPGAAQRVDYLMAQGLVVETPRPDRDRTYAIDTRDSVSPIFRNIVIETIDRCVPVGGRLRLAAVANSGTLLCALWAGASGRPFWNVLVDGPRTRGFGRNLEPITGVQGEEFLLVDNHARTGASLRVATKIVESHGGCVASAMVFTAGDHVDFDRPLFVALPHELLVEGLRLSGPAAKSQRGQRKVDVP